MAPRKIGIVGCGYVGSAVGAALAKLGHDVLGTTTSPDRVEVLRDQGIKPAIVRLDQRQDLQRVLLDREIVILTVSAGQGGQTYREVYLDGVGHLLAAVESAAAERIIYTSSTSVYGQQDGGWVNEESPTEPKSESGRILLDAERALLDESKTAGLKASILRLSGIYGPGRAPADWAARWAGKERSDGAAYLNLIHRDDIVAAMLALVNQPYHGVLNLTCDEPAVRSELYDRLLADLGLPAVRWVESDGPARLGKRVRNRRLKEALGIELQHPRVRWDE